MMTCFLKTDTVWQIVLLILSQLTVFSCVIGVVLLFRRGCALRKLIRISVAFLLNTFLYTTLQLDSRITKGIHGIHLHSPYILLFLVVVLSFAYSLWALLSETKVRKGMNRNSIKEAFDNLPKFLYFA